ncbi:hypothetical protein MASR1M46_18960 [Bacteroidales bacterium]
MTDINTDNVKSQMRKGVLEYCILSILNNNDAYASSLIEELKSAKMIVVGDPLSTSYKTEEPGYAKLQMGGVSSGTSESTTP